jgi:hypothetical protein
MNKMGLKILFGTMLIAIILFFWSMVAPYFYHNFKIVKVLKFTDDLSVVFVETDVTSLYILDNNEIKEFKNNDSFSQKMILRAKRIYESDINLTIRKKYLDISLSQYKYFSGRILHFQNYITNHGKEYKILLSIVRP